MHVDVDIFIRPMKDRMDQEMLCILHLSECGFYLPCGAVAEHDRLRGKIIMVGEQGHLVEITAPYACCIIEVPKGGCKKH